MRRLLLALLMLTLVTPLAAQPTGDALVAGKDYVLVEPAQATATAGKIEVLEAFSYGCSACSAAQPYVDRWKAKLPATTAFAYLPVTFRPDFALLARGYLAAQALGVAERTHQPMFDAMRGGTPVTRIEDVADLYAKLGVDRAQFLAAASSFAVSTRLKRIEQSLPRYGIDSSPTFIVAGKYRLTARMAGSYERLFAVIDQLVAREAQASVTAPSAP